MDIQSLVRELKTQNSSKIVLLVADGLGGLPIEPGGPTELEAAKTPNLDALARRGVQGSMYPVAPGITPGSGPGPPRPVRLRSGQAPDRPRGPGGDRRGLQARAEGRGRTLQLLHPRRRRQHLRPPRRPHPHRRERPAGHQAAAGEGAGRRAVRRAGQGAPVRASSSAAKGSAATWPTPTRRRPACRRWPRWPTTRQASGPPRWPRSSSPRPKNSWPASRRPMG